MRGLLSSTLWLRRPRTVWMARRAYQDRLAPQAPMALLVYLALPAILVRMGRRAWLVLLASLVRRAPLFLTSTTAPGIAALQLMLKTMSSMTPLYMVTGLQYRIPPRSSPSQRTLTYCPSITLGEILLESITA